MRDAPFLDERINWPEPIAIGPATDAPRPPRKPRVMSIVSWIVGLLMLPLSVLPFIAYTHFDRTGNLLMLRVERYFADPAAPELPPGEAAMYAATALQYRDALAVLALPEIIDGPGHPGALSPARFARDVRMLEAAGYHAVAPEQVVSWLDGKTVLPENAVLLTFDAARADVVLNAAPVLKDVEMRATVFPIGGAYEKNPVWFSSPSSCASWSAASAGRSARSRPRTTARSRSRAAPPPRTSPRSSPARTSTPSAPVPARSTPARCAPPTRSAPARRSRTRGPMARGAATGAPTTWASARSISRRRARCSASASRSTRRSRSAC